MTKLCKDCKYFMNSNIPFTLAYGRCKLSQRIIPPMIDPVSGSEMPSKTEYGYASVMRKHECEDGKLYQYEEDSMKRFLNQNTGSLTAFRSVFTYTSLVIILYGILTK